MDNLSNYEGSAYEFAFLTALEAEISPIRSVSVEKNGSYYAAQYKWNTLSAEEKKVYERSAVGGVRTLCKAEPLLTEDDGILILKFQEDKKDDDGDVRDLLISRGGTEWEIGLSISRSRLVAKRGLVSKTLDFGKRWFGLPCSLDYWNEIASAFKTLKAAKAANMKWVEIPQMEREDNIYIPFLAAFAKEFQRLYKRHGSLFPQRIIAYMLGRYAFYKVNRIDEDQTTQLVSFNFNGELNQAGKSKPALSVPAVPLPTQIIHLRFKPDSTDTLELYMNSGWQLSFRLNYTSVKVDVNMKIDIEIINMPPEVTVIDGKWE
ncbi:MAG: HaeIII family restriction endonuclease [Oscillospiraceae bacterium]|jgi:hypothetical protein|nr:HaeIII family restriction endonuclease [Oscillospiraceae bacterium]